MQVLTDLKQRGVQDILMSWKESRTEPRSSPAGASYDMLLDHACGGGERSVAALRFER
jgi:hypothetical protein